MFNVDRCQDQRKGIACLAPCSCVRSLQLSSTRRTRHGASGYEVGLCWAGDIIAFKLVGICSLRCLFAETRFEILITKRHVGRNCPPPSRSGIIYGFNHSALQILQFSTRILKIYSPCMLIYLHEKLWGLGGSLWQRQ